MGNGKDEKVEQKKTGGEKFFSIFLMVACAALAVLVLLLAQQNRSLKTQLSTLLTPQIPPEGMKAGDVLEPLALLDDGGNRLVINFEGLADRTLLLFFSPDCPACRETIPLWSAVLSKHPSTVRVTGIRLGAGIEEAPNLPFAVYTPEDGGESLAGKIPFVPATVVLDEEGTIERVWYGVLDEEKQTELAGILSASS
jgi:hypothetical protein